MSYLKLGILADTKTMKNKATRIGILAFCLLLAVALSVSAFNIVKAYSVPSSISFGDVGTVNLTVSDSAQAEQLLGGTTVDDMVIDADLTVSASTTVNDLSVTGTFAFDDPLSLNKALSAGAITGSSTAVFKGRVTLGGDVYSSSTSKNFTLTATEFCDKSVKIFSPSSETDVTLPATSTVTACLPYAGSNTYSLWINAGTSIVTPTSTTDYTFLHSSTTDNILAGGSALIKCFKTSTKIYCGILSNKSY